MRRTPVRLILLPLIQVGKELSPRRGLDQAHDVIIDERIPRLRPHLVTEGAVYMALLAASREPIVSDDHPVVYEGPQQGREDGEQCKELFHVSRRHLALP